MAALVKTINETITVAEARASSATARLAEVVAILEKRRSNGVGSASDILIGAGDLTEQEFAAIISAAGPVGYGEFRNFLDGDHEYSKAVFRAVMQGGVSGIPRLLNLGVTVDLPDLFDRGTANASAASPVWVAFNRTFTAVSEVMATLKGGSVVAAPRVSGITEAGFFIELLDQTNARVAGTVSWSAKGY